MGVREIVVADALADSQNKFTTHMGREIVNDLTRSPIVVNMVRSDLN